MADELNDLLVAIDAATLPSVRVKVARAESWSDDRWHCVIAADGNDFPYWQQMSAPTPLAAVHKMCRYLTGFEPDMAAHLREPWEKPSAEPADFLVEPLGYPLPARRTVKRIVGRRVVEEEIDLPAMTSVFVQDVAAREAAKDVLHGAAYGGWRNVGTTPDGPWIVVVPAETVPALVALPGVEVY